MDLLTFEGMNLFTFLFIAFLAQPLVLAWGFALIVRKFDV